MGLTRSEILDLPMDTGDAYLVAYNEILNPNRPTKFKVRRQKNKKK